MNKRKIYQNAKQTALVYTIENPKKIMPLLSGALRHESQSRQ